MLSVMAVLGVQENKMKPKPHQRRAGRKLYDKLVKYGIVILAGEVRSGKTLAFVYAALLANVKSCLIITKKGALKDIKKAVPSFCTVTNFHQVKNLELKEYDLIIIDEFHRYISNAGKKRSPIWNDILPISYYTPIIFSSGTPTPETYASIYSPLALSCKSPFVQYKNYTAWHKDYGIPYNKVIGYDERKRKPKTAKGWDKGNTKKIQKDIEHLIVTITQEEAGHKYFAQDKLHHIPLSHRQQRIYDVLDTDKLYELPDDYTILADTAGKLLQKKHQISGGFVNAVDDFDESKTKVHSFKSIPKVKYILDNFDVENTMILAYYIPEQKHLSKLFPHVASLSKNSDGVDYNHFEHLVIYSFGFHAVTYEQVRGRQMNFHTRDSEVIIHFLVSGIDEYVYEAVSNKKDFTASWYKKNKKLKVLK